ncbi:hypothetical protein LPJ78_002032 [Coemansia sp. RSA 989]|nr:ankyrin repeat-containing domain protein [Coemansia mojavensis]KAJ1741223.1 hypothetical protein LPJ68_003042 [Coemansia sp. RSA 1086]KAJ1751519.1 hypothetical protein LPJ79_001997 [Coemansia sp. RSA 1821]KAJ1866209.1 hypothetical protein LPJ78_002032 [Coemansia sp. RSA 989]KAJ1873438.1 hypothetical protein LPJ55_002293 [Coemansia sp. RSA 990]KAJ2633307.1 hypothetical protein H4R22_000591 [Coemansia sp. RSA 1290]KAJ2647960.1 hypothetical protein IWW40_004283 [Coemansia sp. RSA 1250]KAJ267
MVSSRPIDELITGTSPLAGAEQRVLREWISQWTFDIEDFSPMAQPLARGDTTALKRDYEAHCAHLQQTLGVSEETSQQQTIELYKNMRETRLQMPAMEVVIAGAQYHGKNDSAVMVNRHGHRISDHRGCLEMLHQWGVPVDAEDVAGFTAFMRASQTVHSRLDLASVLLELGADVNHRSRFGGIALHEAIMAQDRVAVAFLSRNGASMDIKDNDGVSPRDIVSLIL